MDGKRFDELTRTIAGSAGSRRGLLRGLAAVAGAAALGRFWARGAEAACKAYGKPCSGGSQCCSGVCTGGICRCQANTKPCAKRGGATVCVATCPPGQSLSSDCRCLCNRNGRPPVNGLCPCDGDGTACVDASKCCAGVCNSSGTCGRLANGAACVGPADCQTNFCHPVTDVCSDPCNLTGQPCQDDSGCCVGLCDEYSGTCIDACLGLGASCAEAEDCCDGGCVANRCCIADGDDCGDQNADCCSGICDDITHTCLAVCLATGAACLDPLDCCSGSCDGVCCLPAGADCSVAGGFDDGACCSGICNDATGLCDDTCAALGEPCGEGDDCCSFGCENNVCCIQSGLGPCSDNFECCSGICDDYTATCAFACLDAGTDCTESEDCCSSLCYGGVCCDGRLDGDFCDFGTDCCSGVCYDDECCGLGTDGEDCSTGDDCCSGFCHDSSQRCCSLADDGAFCADAAECCSGRCDLELSACIPD